MEKSVRKISDAVFIIGWNR